MAKLPMLYIIQEVIGGCPQDPHIFTDAEKAMAFWLKLWDAGYKYSSSYRQVRKTKAWSKMFLQDNKDGRCHILKWVAPLDSSGNYYVTS